MRTSRIVPALAAGALLATTIAPAGAATPGVGATAGTLSVLEVTAGNLLSLSLLSDRGDANTVGPKKAAAQVLLGEVTSPALGVAETFPLVKVESTEGAKSQQQAVTPVDNPALDGSLLPVDLSASVDASGAVSGISAGLGQLDVLGGVLSIDGAELGLDSKALGDAASGLRGIELDAVTVLDLTSLLASLGIDLGSLPTETVLGLVDSLGVLGEVQAALDTLGLDADLEDIGDLESLVGTLETNVGLLQDLTVSLGEGTCDAASDGLGVLGDLLGQDVATLCDDVAATLQLAMDQVSVLVDELTGILDAVIDVLDGTALLGLDGLQASVTTKAAATVAESVADVTATLGGFRVGQLQIPGVDLLSTVDQVNATLAQVEGTLGGVLGQIDPVLADLVDVEVLKKATSITEQDGAVISDASLDALSVTVKPDVAALLGLIERLAEGTSVGDVLADLGAPVPDVAGGVLDLNAALADLPTSGIATPDSVLALSEGAAVKFGSISQRSTFAAQAAPGGVETPASPSAPAEPTLPRTGGPATPLLLLGAAAALGALGVRRWAIRPVA